MNRLFPFYVLLVVYLQFFVVRCTDEETVNTCVAHSMPAETLALLMQSSGKILKINTNELKSNLLTIKENLDNMKETIATLSRSSESEFINKSLNDVLTHQKTFSEMLNSVFNTVLNNNKVIDDMNAEHSQNFLKLREKIEELANKKEITKEEVVPKVESIIPELTSSNERNNCRSTELSDSEILKKQNEINELLQSLVADTWEQKTLLKQLDRVSSENHILKEKLDKYQGGTRPPDCSVILTNGIKTNGVYEIYPNRCDCGPSSRVWCDMKTEGGGWTVILQRSQIKKLENFTRSWSEYEKGFGHPESEYWIGLRSLHQLTAFQRFVLRVDVTDKSNRLKWAQWKKFEVASGEEKYRLSVGDFEMSSTLGDVFRSHNNQYFSTVDSDNDSSYDKDCAGLMQGGWWYGKCYDFHPTGSFSALDVRKGVSTGLFSHNDKALVSLKKVTLKIKPLECVMHNSVSFSTKSCNNN